MPPGDLDAEPRPCPRCSRPIVVATFPWGKQPVHTGTWSVQCGEPTRAEQAIGLTGLPSPPSGAEMAFASNDSRSERWP